MGEKRSTEQAFQNYLRSGEQVRWHGATKPFSLLERDARFLILGKWIGSVGVSAVILSMTIPGDVTAVLLRLYIGNSPDWSLKAVIAVLLVAALLIVSPFVEKWNVLGQQYWITDQRVIFMSRDRTFYYMELADIDDIRLVEGQTEEGTLVVGSRVFEDIKRQLRWRACHPKTNVQSDGPMDKAEGLVLFSVSDSKKAADCLRQQLGWAA